jgi:membrane protein implicated in regulation of membrane protease activity
MMLKIFMSVLYQAKQLLESDSRKAETSLYGFTGKAKVSETIVGPSREGRVYFRGTWWPARCEQLVTLKPGDPVQVIDMSNITLLVEPFPCSSF